MKIILEFDDMDEARLAMDGVKWRSAMHDLDNALRARIKYGEHEERFRNLETVEAVRDYLYDIFNENGLSFDE